MINYKNRTLFKINIIDVLIMYKNLPPLKSLKAFESTARQMSFNLAAKELFVTQSAISHQIRLLETFLGKKMFIRQGKVLSLSKAGIEYFPIVHRIFSSLDLASAKAMGQVAGATRLAVPSSFALKCLIPRLPDFRKLHPEIDLRLKMMTEMELDLDLLGVDCAISIRYNNPLYNFTHLNSEDWFPVCSPEIFHQFSQLPLKEAIQTYPLLEDEHQNEWHRLFTKLGITHSSNQPIHYFSHIILLQQAAIEGQGLALSSKMLADDDIKAGRLVRIPIDLETTTDSFTHLYFCSAKDRQYDAPILALQKWLKNTFSQ